MAMRLDLSHLRQAETEFDRRYEPAAFAGDEAEFRVVAPVALRMVVHKDQDRFRLVGTVETVLELSCGRCLEPFVFPVDRAFDLRYFPQGTADAGREPDEVELDDEDVALSFYRDEEIDLGELMREQFYLTLPMKPLCRPACKGICPQCGANRNTEACDCESRWEDPRLAGLKSFITNRKPDDA